MERSVIVTGANGFVGKNISKFLLQNGFSVTGIVRKGRANFGRTIISKDLSENDLAKKVLGSSALLHFIGRGKQTVESDYETVNVGLTSNAIDLCKKTKIKKVMSLNSLLTRISVLLPV